jgi:hypothetical protein
VTPPERFADSYESFDAAPGAAAFVAFAKLKAEIERSGGASSTQPVVDSGAHVLRLQTRQSFDIPGIERS